VFVFGSTSKITLAGAGVSFLGMSEANLAWWLAKTAKRTIGPDKINHLRHARFLGSAEGVAAHMAKHREILAPKFAAVERILTEQLGAVEGVSWTRPAGGYFVTLTVPAGLASAIVALAKDAGVVLTPAGATHPYGTDPDDAIIRLAPSFPVLDEVEKATAGVATCVKLAIAQQGA
jgi:DNA-binding transcriptional MocR family regulator